MNRIGWSLILCLVALGVPAQAYAQGIVDACPPPDTVGLTEYVITCFRGALIPAAEAMCRIMMEALGPAILAIIMLALVIFGFKLTSGMVRQVNGEMVLLLIKIGGVVYFTQNFVEWIPRIFEVMDGLLIIITEILLEAAVIDGCPDPDNLWARVDCIMGAFFGIGILTSLFSGLLGLIIGLGSNGSDLGMLAFMGGAAAGFSFFFSIARAVYGFIVANIAITFLAILSPLFVPMLLLESTKQYFNKWIQSFFSYILQPVFLFGFIALAIVAVDRAVFTGDFSIAAALFGEPVTTIDEWNVNMQQFYETHAINEEQVIARAFIQQEEMGEAASPDGENWDVFQREGFGNSYIPKIFGPDPDADVNMEEALSGLLGSSDGGMFMGMNITNISTSLQYELIIMFFSLAAICYILYMIMEVVPDIARDVVGSFSHVKIGQNALPLQAEARTAIANAEGLFSNLASSQMRSGPPGS